MILIPRANKALLTQRLEKLLEEALYPGIDSRTRATIQGVLAMIAASPDDVNCICRLQVIPERRCMQVVLEIVDVA